jgi:glycosyltransferase involved in cell wall biosynthesis
MPVFRPHPRHFPEAVASILAQTMTDFELLIVEDPDSLPLSASGRGPGGGVGLYEDPTRFAARITLPEAERVEESNLPLSASGRRPGGGVSAAELLSSFNDPRIRLVSNPERTGLISQRNRTLAKAKAEWVAMLDADDAMEPDRLAKQWEYVQQHPETDVLGSRLTIINAEGQAIGSRSYPQTHEEIGRAFRRFNAIPQPATLARKSAILDAGGYTFEFPVEDYDLWSRMAGRGAKFANHPEALTRYRIGGGSKNDKLRNTIRLTREVKRRYWKKQMTPRDRLRYWGEGALLCLPAGLVVRLFRMLTYRGTVTK